MENEKIKNKFEDCFKNCALARIQLKKCIINAMDAGLIKPDILAIANEIPASVEPSDASLCSIIAVGQVIKYEKKTYKNKKKYFKR